MYCINGTDPVFDTLLTEKDRYCFNLFYRIREDTGAYIATDGSTCILAQSNSYTPVWIWLKNSPDEKSCAEISSILRERFSVCGRVSAVQCGLQENWICKTGGNNGTGDFQERITPQVLFFGALFPALSPAPPYSICRLTYRIPS